MCSGEVPGVAPTIRYASSTVMRPRRTAFAAADCAAPVDCAFASACRYASAKPLRRNCPPYIISCATIFDAMQAFPIHLSSCPAERCRTGHLCDERIMRRCPVQRRTGAHRSMRCVSVLLAGRQDVVVGSRQPAGQRNIA